MCSEFIQVVSDLSRQCTYFTYQMCSIYMSWCFDICTHPLADSGPETVFSVLEVMRAAEVASRALSRNLSMDLPPDYTPLSLAEVFYMATMGGARGINQTPECMNQQQATSSVHHNKNKVLLVNCYCTCGNLINRERCYCLVNCRTGVCI